MLPSLSIDRRTIALGVGTTVRLLVDVAAPPTTHRAGPPLDVVVVLDGATGGTADPFGAAAATAAELLRVARPDDRIGVVSVDRDVVVVLPLGHHDPDLVARSVRMSPTESDGGTGEAGSVGGRSIAAQLLATGARDGADQRILVLTDGGPAARLAQLVGAGVAGQGVALSLVPSAAVAKVELLDPPLPVGDSVPHAPFGHAAIHVPLGDTYGGEVRRVALALGLHPPTAEGMLDLGAVQVRWHSTGPDQAMHTVELPVVVHVDPVGDLLR